MLQDDEAGFFVLFVCQGPVGYVFSRAPSRALAEMFLRLVRGVVQARHLFTGSDTGDYGHLRHKICDQGHTTSNQVIWYY